MGQPAAGRLTDDRRPRRSLRRAGVTVVPLVVVLVLIVAVRAFVAAPVSVSSDSMSTTLQRGDVVLVDKLSTRLGDVGRGDVVTFASPDDGSATLKRVVGVASDVVEIRDAVLFVNDRRVDESYVDYAASDGTYFGPVTVPAGTVFVMGDNRSASIDSREFGAVPLEDVTGQVRQRLWPLRR